MTQSHSWKAANTFSKDLVLILGTLPTCLPRTLLGPWLLCLGQGPGALWSLQQGNIHSRSSSCRQRNRPGEVTKLPPGHTVSAAKPDPGHASVSPAAPCPLCTGRPAEPFCRLAGFDYDPTRFHHDSVSFLEADPNRDDWKYKHRCISWQVKIENYTEQ